MKIFGGSRCLISSCLTSIVERQKTKQIILAMLFAIKSLASYFPFPSKLGDLKLRPVPLFCSYAYIFKAILGLYH